MEAANLFCGLIFSSLGLAYFVYGKKQGMAVPLLCGLTLMIYPYFIPNVWVSAAIGGALAVVPFFFRY